MRNGRGKTAKPEAEVASATFALGFGGSESSSYICEVVGGDADDGNACLRQTMLPTRTAHSPVLARSRSLL